MDTNEPRRGSWIWEMDLFTLLNLGFDVCCLGVCIHRLTSSYFAYHHHHHRTIIRRHHHVPPPLRLKKSSSLTSPTSPTTSDTKPSFPVTLPPTSPTTTARTRGNSVNGNGTNGHSPTNGQSQAVPNVMTMSFSIWANKPFWIVMGSTIATLLWHLNRLLLVFALTWDTVQRGNEGRSSENKTNGNGEMDEEEMGMEMGNTQDSNPFLRPPALYIVLFLPVVLVLSRTLLLASFGFPKKGTKPAVEGEENDHQHQQQHANTFQTSTSLFSMAVDTFTSRLYGSNRNMYMLAFYACVFGLMTFVPFTYSPVWYFDTPRVEFVTSLYLAGVLKDAKKVKKGLSLKEKRQRGLSSFERLVYLRWFVTLLTIAGVGPEFGARFVFDGSVLYALSKLESA